MYQVIVGSYSSNDNALKQKSELEEKVLKGVFLEAEKDNIKKEYSSQRVLLF